MEGPKTRSQRGGTRKLKGSSARPGRKIEKEEGGGGNVPISQRRNNGGIGEGLGRIGASNGSTVKETRRCMNLLVVLRNPTETTSLGTEGKEPETRQRGMGNGA